MWPFSRQRQKVDMRKARIVRARYDAAQTTDDNSRHWLYADQLSPDKDGSLSVRKTLRSRSRYEVANNSYAKGVVLTLANDCVGTGPRLQLVTQDDELNRYVEDGFSAWAKAVRLAVKLRQMRAAKIVDGESFAMLRSNPLLDDLVKLDIYPIECDRVTTSSELAAGAEETEIDGIMYDVYGNPKTYTVLRAHPGDQTYLATNADAIPASQVIHWFRPDRPEQHRGIPELVSAIPLFAQLRRYTLAVLAAAETAADFAAVLYTDSPANGESVSVEAMDVVELEKRMATVLPDGWKLSQIEAQQPTTTYGEFKRELLAEIGRCLQVPINVITGDSSRHNYASGRLDHQVYFKSLRIEQNHMADIVLDRIFSAWFSEAKLLSEFAFLRSIPLPNHQWFFDGNEHVDPSKEASAQETRLANHTTTLAAEYAKQGKDWESELRQRATEIKLMRELDLVVAAPAAPGDAPADD